MGRSGPVTVTSFRSATGWSSRCIAGPIRWRARSGASPQAMATTSPTWSWRETRLTPRLFTNSLQAVLASRQWPALSSDITSFARETPTLTSSASTVDAVIPSASVTPTFTVHLPILQASGISKPPTSTPEYRSTEPPLAFRPSPTRFSTATRTSFVCWPKPLATGPTEPAFEW